MDKKKVFVSAYACEPGKGSEIGVGWNWIMQMSKYYKLWVMTRESNKENIEKWFEKHPNTNQIDFVYYDLPAKYRKWKQGEKGVRKYYVLWQKNSNRVVMQTMLQHDIETYHLLTFGNALWPASKFGMTKEFVWGPIGGIECVEKEYVKDLRLKTRFVEFVRRRTVGALGWNSAFKKRCENANTIICKSETVKNNLPEQYQKKAIVCTDVAVDEIILERKSETSSKDKIKIFAAGRLDGWRGFNLLIEAFNNVLSEHEEFELEIAGDGVARRDLEKISAENSDKIKLLGHISAEEYEARMDEADIVINPVLREGGVTVAYEALGLGKALICVNTDGYTRDIDEEAAVIIERTNRAQIVREMTVAILKLKDEAIRKDMGAKAKAWAKKHTWDEKGKEIAQIGESN